MFTFRCVSEQVCGFQQVVLFGVLKFSDYYYKVNLLRQVCLIFF